ncbi:hypothetical protein GCM10022294_02500 [Dietzia aurantiaca]
MKCSKCCARWIGDAESFIASTLVFAHPFDGTKGDDDDDDDDDDIERIGGEREGGDSGEAGLAFSPGA